MKINWTKDQETKYLQLSRDAALQMRSRGNVKMATEIEATASQLVFLIRHAKEQAEFIDDKMGIVKTEVL